MSMTTPTPVGSIDESPVSTHTLHCERADDDCSAYCVVSHTLLKKSPTSTKGAAHWPLYGANNSAYRCTAPTLG